MLRILFLIFVLYLLYKLVFDFIIPVSKATSNVKSKLREMQGDQMNRQQQSYNGASTSTQKASTKNTDAEYIDFEEVK